MRARVFFCLLCFAAAARAGEEMRLAETPALSPDGRTLVFAWRGDLWQVSSAGGTARRITFHPGVDRMPRFSRDGRRLAFVSDRQGSDQVFVMEVGGGTPRQVTFHSEGSTVHDWFPDGRALLIRGARDHFWRRPGRFFLQRLDGQAAPVLLFDDHGAAGQLSPDGRTLAFVREGTPWWRKGYVGSQASQVWLYDTAARTGTRLSRGLHEERWPLWHPGSRRLYVTSQEDGTHNLWELDLDTGDRVQRTHFEEDGVTFPCISADGAVIVFRRLFDLYRLEPEGRGEPQRLRIVASGDIIHPVEERRTLTQAAQVAFSDDGREIAFVAGGDLWVMDTELREPVQVTRTPEEERDPVFAPDFRSIVFVSEAGGRCDLWRVRPADGNRHWWQNRAFRLERLTNDAEPEAGPRFTPDGRLAFTSLRGDLWTMKADGTDTRVLLRSWNPPSYAFSPDGRWVAYAVSDNDFNRDIWIMPADGSGAAINISRHPDWESDPVWSPDGRLLAFTGERAHRESDIYFVWLRKADDDRSKRDRTLQKALEKMKGRAGAEQEEQGKRKDKEEKPKLPEVVIDFEEIQDRIRRISLPDTAESQLMWSPDSQRLAFRAKIGGKDGIYTVAVPDELKPKLLTDAPGTQGRWLKESDQIVWLQRGRPASVTASGKATAYDFRLQHEVNLLERHLAAFDLAWRTLGDRWYDDRMNNRDWKALRAKYRPMASRCVTTRELDAVVSLMLGELNGSHLGFWSREAPAWLLTGWRDVTWHFGARFDASWKGAGLRIKDVIAGTPAARAMSRLEPGEVILRVGGRTVDPSVDLAHVMTGPLDREVVLLVRGQDGKEREVSLRPSTFGAVRSLLYEHWLEHTRRRVDELSGGRLGYLHVRGMNWPSFERFEAELYRVGHGKEGLLLDVRENGGGFTADHLLTCLCQPVHAVTVPRGGGPGYPQDRMVYARWSKPVVVLCNQNSFSNAEIFAHAIKTLGRGRLVGVPTAGGVISTDATRIMGFAVLRLPFRGWFVGSTGRDMELNGCTPHVVLWPQLEEMPRGIDRQLEKGIALLLEDVARWKARPRPRLERHSER
ncbi:MAG: S41 family peptidase [Planctomycetota bacterium]